MMLGITYQFIQYRRYSTEYPLYCSGLSMVISMLKIGGVVMVQLLHDRDAISPSAKISVDGSLSVKLA
jgi:hypothetical protein